MNESMLHSLMHLFAIIASINKDTIFVLARNFVESYLNQQLSKKLADKYLSVFDYYFNDIESNTDAGKVKKTSSMSVKILTICENINKELPIREKFQILLSLLQFNKYFEGSVIEDSGFNQSINDSVKTISDGLMIRNEEYKNCQAFITDKFYKVPSKDRILVVSDDKSFGFSDIKHLQKDGLNGQLFVLLIKRADTYLFHYLGKDKLDLNGRYIFPRHVYYLPKGGAIRGESITPLYFSDISSSFNIESSQPKISFYADEIEFQFKNSTNGIQQFSFFGESGQLIGIMGGSGTGKSTLLKVLNGSLKVNRGSIYINGLDIHSKNPELDGLIGFIPQDDLLIEDLNVFQNLFYSARLCLDNYTDDIIDNKVVDLLTDLGLHEIMDLKVGSLLNKFISGGQRKRLNIALELIREPFILFVDEPTSGLSSVDSENVIYLLKEQAAKGKLVMVNIHQPSSDLFKMFDKLIVLDKGGFPIYYGNPVEAIMYFKKMTDRVDAGESECPSCGNSNPDEILSIIESRDFDEYGEYTQNRKIKPVEWYNMYKSNIQSKLTFSKLEEKIPENPFKIPGILKQFIIFTKRNFLAKLADRQFMMIALIVAPLLAVILGYFTKYVSGSETNLYEYVFKNNDNLPAYLFMSIIVALFLGMIISAEEIIKDRKILERESFLNLSRSPYLISKVVFLFGLSALQMILFVFIGNAILQIKSMTFSYWLILFSTSCFANMLGLNISDGLKSVVAIYVIVPFLLVPQLLLAGVIVKFDKLHYLVASHENVPVAGDVMASRWAYEALAVNQFKNNKYEKNFFLVNKQESNISYEAHHLIPAILEKLDDAEVLFNNDRENPEIDDLLVLVLNSLEDVTYLDPELSFDDILIRDNTLERMADIRTRLLRIQEYLSGKRDDLSYQLDDISREMISNMVTPQQLAELKQNHFNESLAGLVKNSNEFRKVRTTETKLVRLMEPIYQVPKSRTGRAQFFSSSKRIGNIEIETVVFNVLAIWFMTIILYVALQFSWLRRFVEFFGKQKR
jgi:ABC-type multidrug transport system ATPase subunit